MVSFAERREMTMKKQVKIKVTGTQAGTDEVITTETMGHMLYKEPYYYVSYEENLDASSEKSSKTTLRFCEDELRVTRKGEVNSALEFQNEKIHNSVYMTSYGNFEVMLVTDTLFIEKKEKSATIAADYRIGFNTMPPTQGRLEIVITESDMDQWI